MKMILCLIADLVLGQYLRVHTYRCTDVPGLLLTASFAPKNDTAVPDVTSFYWSIIPPSFAESMGAIYFVRVFPMTHTLKSIS